MSLGLSTREFILEEEHVVNVLKVINKHRKLYGYRIGNCGWSDMPTKWFIMFDVTDKTYGKIVRDLRRIGDFNLEVSPSGVVNISYEIA